MVCIFIHLAKLCCAVLLEQKSFVCKVSVSMRYLCVRFNIVPPPSLHLCNVHHYIILGPLFKYTVCGKTGQACSVLHQREGAHPGGSRQDMGSTRWKA